MVKILDFGLAKLAGTEGVTQTGTTVGMPFAKRGAVVGQGRRTRPRRARRLARGPNPRCVTPQPRRRAMRPLALLVFGHLVLNHGQFCAQIVSQAHSQLQLSTPPDCLHRLLLRRRHIDPQFSLQRGTKRGQVAVAHHRLPRWFLKNHNSGFHCEKRHFTLKSRLDSDANGRLLASAPRRPGRRARRGK